MTREQKITKARRLRKTTKLTLREIGERLGGVSPTTVLRWTDDAQYEKQLRNSREAKRRRQIAECADCGNKLAYDSQEKERCQRCEMERKWGPRRQEISRRWKQGQSIHEIGEALGLDPLRVNSYVQHRREKGDEGFPLRQLPHTDHAERYIQLGEWVRAGLTNPEIAERLGTTPGSVNIMLGNARRKGFDVPHRRDLKAAA